MIPRDEYLATLAQAERMRFLEDEPGVGSMAEGALKFVLAHEAVASVVAGMMRPLEVDLNVKASGKGLSDEAVERVREVYKEGLSGG